MSCEELEKKERATKNQTFMVIETAAQNIQFIFEPLKMVMNLVGVQERKSILHAKS